MILADTQPVVNGASRASEPARQILWRVGGEAKRLPVFTYQTSVEWISQVKQYLGTCSVCNAQKIGGFTECHNFVNQHEWAHRYDAEGSRA